MPAIPGSRILLVWGVLVGATCVSWFLGADHGIDNHALVTAAVLAVAFVKLRLVGMHFMELDRARQPLRGLFEGYVIVVLGALLVLYNVL
ncbi:MAG: hypothetical protein JWO02_581 [Solirubrobacterales bacterium]|nr:hypothetical protein [Solirubrobacterales bacterium]